MSRGPRIRQWVKWYVATEARRNRAEPQDSVIERIEEYLSDKEAIPARDTLVKMISKARNDDPEDWPWRVATLADSDIAPEALPAVMRSWAWALEHDTPLTIRQVKWMARLYYVLKDKDVDFPNSLAERALTYANIEKAMKSKGMHPEAPRELWWLWWNDAILYVYMTGDDGPLWKCAKGMAWPTYHEFAKAFGTSGVGMGKVPLDLLPILAGKQKGAKHERINKGKR